MEYIHAALLLHSAGKKVDETGLTNVIKAAGAEVDEGRVKALVSALEGVNIDEAVKSAAMPVVAPTAAAQPAPKAEEKKEEKKEAEEKKEEGEALAGLGALFG